MDRPDSLMSLARLLYVKVRNSLFVLIGLALFGGAIAAWYTYQTRMNLHRAELSFTVTNSSENMGGVSSILNQFGLPSSGGSQINLSKLAYFSRSNLIVYNVLLEKTDLRGDTLRIIEYILKSDLVRRDANLEEEYLDEKSILLVEEVDYLEFENSVSPHEKKLVKRCISYLVGNIPNTGAVKLFYDDISGIIELNVETPDEELSAVICNKFYQEIQDFYTKSELKQRTETVRLLSEKKDSLQNILANLNDELSRVQDRLRSVPLNSSKTKTTYLNTQINIALVAYGEVVRNYETASFVMQSSRPAFQIINYPILPLPEFSDSWIKSGIIIAFVIGFLGVLFIITYNLYDVFERG